MAWRGAAPDPRLTARAPLPPSPARPRQALADDVTNQEIIAREVRDFMTTGGSVKVRADGRASAGGRLTRCARTDAQVNDMKELEANIRAKLTGERPGRLVRQGH